MTVSGDFIPAEENQAFESDPTYPVAFGIELNPKVQGIGVALVGIVGAVFLYTQVIQPTQETKASLKTSIEQKEAQLAQQEASLRQIEEVQAALDRAVEQRAEIYSLLGDANSLDTLLLDINQQIKGSNAGLSRVVGGGLQTLGFFDQYFRTLGFSPQQRERLRAQFVEQPAVRFVYQAELHQFTPQIESSGVVNDGVFGPQLDGKLERQTVTVSIQALFQQTQAIIRNLERLEPLVIMKDFQQDIAPPRGGVSEEDLQGLPRPLNTNFTLEVLVPTGGPGDLPEPPPAGDQPASEG